MIGDGNKGSYATDLSVRVGSGQQNLNSYQTLAAQRDEVENSIMEMEGRGYSDIYRNTSEDLFLKSLMESSIGMPIPTMEMLGLKNISQNFRTDSEELFKSWLTTGENHGHNSSSIPHRTRQASRRMSTELASLSSQQHDGMFQKKKSDSYMPQNISAAEDLSSEFNPLSIRNVVDRGLQASNLYLAKAWFHSSQPMTRSRSSELRRKYVAMQNSQTTIGMEALLNASGHGVDNLKQEFANPNGFSEASMCQIPNQLGVFMSPSNSSSSTFNNSPQMGNVDKVSSVVSMLKGTLERKKLNNYTEKEAVEDSSNGLYSDQEFMIETRLDQGQGNHFHEMPAIFQEVSAIQHKDPAVFQADERPIDLDLEGFLTPTHQNQLNTISQEPSQSESSAAAPVVSSGFEACDGPSNSGQTLSISECSRRQVGSSRISENGSKSKVASGDNRFSAHISIPESPSTTNINKQKAINITYKDFRDHIFDNLKEDQKRGSLVRYGSSTSAGSVDKGDPNPTKKRRVERSRKMAEAKEKSSTPAIPSDMQAVLKRCENLEKEVRSLKLNLSFMNRKDSEQTKQIEELQMQNEELADEKERLLEEIERILSKIGKM